MHKIKKSTLALAGAAVLAGGLLVGAESASGATVGSYEVNVRRCPGSSLQDADINTGTGQAGLKAAFAQYRSSIVYNERHYGEDTQVRVVQYSTSTTSVLLDSYDPNC